MSIYSNDYSWLGWLFGIGICILVVFSLSSTSNSNSDNSDNIQRDKEDAISLFISDIEEQYSDLAEDARQLVGSIDEECVWLSDNISEGVGDYCSDSANSNYKAIQNANYWSVSDITYDIEDELVDILSDIQDQANSAYNDLLFMADHSQGMMEEECAWVTDNISEDIGDYCWESINQVDHDGDPFDANDYL